MIGRMVRRRAVAIAGIGALAIGLACSGDESAVEIGQGEVMERIAAGTAPTFIDVRTPEEYDGGHVPGALNIPYDELEDRAEEIRHLRDGEVVLYCESSRRATEARKTLLTLGFTNLRHLRGDMSAWREAELPTE